MTYSMQEMFDRSTLTVFAQGGASRVADSSNPQMEDCLYQNPDNRVCAIGALFLPGAYSPDLEGLPLKDPRVMRAMGLSPEEQKNRVLRGFLARLQYHHDCYAPLKPENMFDWQRWLLELREVAFDYGLDHVVVNSLLAKTPHA
jgi:hypothetical protein